MVTVDRHALAHADARSGRPHHRDPRRHQRSRRRHRDHPAQARHSRRARRRGGRRGHAHWRRRAREGHGRPHRLPRPHRRHDRRRARARLRRCDLDRAAAERALLARRAHRRRLALRAGGLGARRRGVRAQHVGVFPGARHPHVPVGAVDRPVQPQSARRPPGAVVPDGGDRQGRRRAPRDARRHHPQRRAHDLHRGQRDPDGPRSRDHGEVPAAGADVRADARAVRDPQRPAPAARVGGLRPAGSAGRAGRGWVHREHHRVRAQRGAPPDRGVHAAGQRDRGRASRVARHAGALPHPREARSAEGDAVRGVRQRLRLQPGRHRRQRHADALPEAGRQDPRQPGGAADRVPDAADHAEGALRPDQRRALRPGGARPTRTSRRRSAAIRT